MNETPGVEWHRRFGGIMGDITALAMFVVISLMMLVAAFLLITWAVDDAKARGKSPILVVAAVILFFPWGWIAWLLFRPENYVMTDASRSGWMTTACNRRV